MCMCGGVVEVGLLAAFVMWLRRRFKRKAR